jgi:hypothetical protein
LGALSFDYPAGWSLTTVGHLKHYETVLGFLASPVASAQESCGPEYVPGAGGGCSDSYSLPPGAIVIRLSRWDGPPSPNGKGAAGLVAADIAAGWQAQTVAGEPAAYDPTYSDGSAPTTGTTVAWFLAASGAQDWVDYSVVATMNGADPAARATVDAVVASLRVTPTP